MRRRPRQLSLKECYAILKLEKKADLQAVKRAYRRRAFELHPDLNPGNPEASQQFQLLNEAYVALSAVLKPAEDAARRKEAQQGKGTDTARESKTGNTPEGEASEAKDAHQEAQQAHTQAGGKKEDTEAEQAGPTHAYAEQDVLRDLLNDPFARRVFEDIYSELSRQQGESSQAGTSHAGHADGPQAEAGARPQERSHADTGQQAQRPRSPHGGQHNPQPPRHEPQTRLHQGNLAWGTPRWDVDMSKGVKGVVKDWLRRQIDEEQSICLPAAGLVPGRRIRLQVRKALAAEPTTIEITLPQDFAIGKPIRLRGLGKKVGPWQGDLYLIIRSQ